MMDDVLDVPEADDESTMSEPRLPRESRNLPERESSGVQPPREAPAQASPDVGVSPTPAPAPDPRLVQYERAMQAQAQQLRAHQQQQAQLRDLVWQLQTQGLSPDQREYAEAQRALRDEAVRVQQAQRLFATQQQQMETVYKEIAVRDFLDEGRKFGVSREDLLQCDTPQEMERLVKRAETQHKQTAAKQVSQKGQVATTSGRAGRPNWLKMDTREMLDKYL